MCWCIGSSKPMHTKFRYAPDYRRPTSLAPLACPVAGGSRPQQHVAHAALVPLSVACHEAAAERELSTLEWPFHSRRRASPE
jgi:hypothetical protein